MLEEAPVDDIPPMTEGGSSPSTTPYSVARHRAQRQLEAAAAANNPDLLIRRLTQAIDDASKVGGVEDLAYYQEELAAQIFLRESAPNLDGFPSMGEAPPLKGITPRRLQRSSADVKAHIDVGQVTSLVGLLTLSDDGVAELRDASQPGAGVVIRAQVYDPHQMPAAAPMMVLQRGSQAPGISPSFFNHLALRDLIEDPAMPFARVVAAIDPLRPGSQLLASQLLRHGPQLPLNSVVYALPGINTEGAHWVIDYAQHALKQSTLAGSEDLPLLASLCLGGEDLGLGRSESGCVFGRAVAIVERGAAYECGWPDSVAPIAIRAAALGMEVEEQPLSKGRWIFHPPAPVEEIAEESPPGKAEAEAEVADAAEAAEGGEAQEEAAPVEGEEDEEEKPPEPEKPDYTAALVHEWLFTGLNRCYSSEECVQRLCSAGVLEAEARSCKEWLAKTEKAGFWGPVVGVRDETARRLEQERLDREEARREERRQRRAEKKRLEDESKAGEGGEEVTEEQD